MPLYITTPIYYVNDTPHLGHAYTTVVADVFARYHRLFGEEVFYLTGTDEHGQKIQNAANERGVAPQQHCDEYAERYKAIWGELNITNDIFMRTTFPYHGQVVSKCLQDLFDRKEIYLAEYEGWYSVSEEMFYQEKDLVDGKSPMGKEVTKVVERNYFFKMSKYRDALAEYIEQNPNYIGPEGKRSEVLGFLKQPLEDLCISRPKARLTWGIELPFDKEFVTYVWFDALLNYASAIGYQQPGKEAEFEKWWPHAVHLVGKDILTTHAVYWSTMLMALGVPLPKQIFAHGWWLGATGSKMSKSEGPVVKPLDVKDLVGVDPLRYFLVKDIVFGNDAKFSVDLVVSRVNTELANNLGNLLSRTTNIAEKYYEGRIPPKTANHPGTGEIEALAATTVDSVERHVRALEPNQAIEAVVQLLTATNRYLETIAPWKTVKTDLALAGESIYTALEALRIAAILLTPVMPSKMAELLTRIGEPAATTITAARSWGTLKPGTAVTKGEPLFPRIELKIQDGES